MVRARIFARTAMGLALALGVTAGGYSAAGAKDKKEEQKAPSFKPSPKFIPAYGAAAKALELASKRPDVIAARQKVVDAAKAINAAPKEGKPAARANFDAALLALKTLLAPEYDLVEKSVVQIVNGDDKFLAGQLLINVGNMAVDKATQKRGVQMQLDSGKLAPADVPKYHAFLGGLAMDTNDYPIARRELQAAIDGGYADPETQVQLADAFILDNQAAAGLKVLHDAITKKGASAPQDWMTYGVVTAYNNKLPAETALLATDLVTYYPTKDNWALAISAVRVQLKYAGQDRLDLLRLTDRTDSYSEKDDFLDYIIYAGPNRLPAEVLKVIDTGLKSGMISASTEMVTDSGSTTVGRVQAQAQSRLAEDKSLLAPQERDARGPKGDAKMAMSAGDAYLSHGMAAKAEEMYRLALTKPGVDMARANLRLGIVLVDQGRYAEAIEALALVTDSRAPIAQLWTAFAKSKLAGK